MEEKSRRHEVWGWKDPRTSLTVELYLPHLENPYFIVCHRDWEAIARSLKRRDGMSIERGLWLARVYYESIEEFFREHPGLRRLDVRYEDFLAEPEAHVRRIASFIGLEPGEERIRRATAFVLFPEEKERLVRKMRREGMAQMIVRGLTNPWKALRYIMGAPGEKVASPRSLLYTLPAAQPPPGLSVG